MVVLGILHRRLYELRRRPPPRYFHFICHGITGVYGCHRAYNCIPEAGVGRTGYGARGVRPQSSSENSLPTATICGKQRVFELHTKTGPAIDTPSTVTLGACGTKHS